MVGDIYLATARYYFVDDLQGALQPAARLQSVLEKIRLGRPITTLALAYLKEQHLVALHRLAIGETPYEIFQAEAILEKASRINAGAVAKAAKEALAAAREVERQHAYELDQASARAERAVRESDPRYIAKMKSRALRSRYGIQDYVEEEHFGVLMAILRKADVGMRLPTEDIAWLSSIGEEYFTDELQMAYHRAEAIGMAADFRTTGNPWSVVTGSGHYRKCNQAIDAKRLLESLEIKDLAGNKLKSAYCTTHGGVMRDLGNAVEATVLGERAHAFMPNDFRPCTLLGALYMESGELQAGREWYEKAVERGATRDSVDRELRSIFFRADMAMKAKLQEFLLAQDSVRYAWALPSAHKAT